MDCSLPGSSVHGIFQARGLEWGARKALALTKLGSNTKFRSPFQLFFFLRRNCSLSTHAYTWSGKYSQVFSRFQFSLLSLLLDETPFLLMSFIYSGRWWWTRKPGMQQSTGSQRVRHDWATEPNWFTLLRVSYHFDDFGIRIQVSLLRAFPIVLGNSKNISEATTLGSQFYTFSTQISFFFFLFHFDIFFPGDSAIQNLPSMQKTWDWSLGQEDPLEDGMAIHSSIFAWRIP